ncbi:hypothetical protein VFPBJ_11748 [Purpureocillium lilacinum]|uniref:Uncharacterized protein n=1 Tax=Purpureocillium lilacinum TaxID=33203 RepID=A0A179EW99_PURLI|nr:hypothetical protein VFPBJ_11748 [Purpureocillium lilacinum]
MSGFGASNATFGGFGQIPPPGGASFGGPGPGLGSPFQPRPEPKGGEPAAPPPPPYVKKESDKRQSGEQVDGESDQEQGDDEEVQSNPSSHSHVVVNNPVAETRPVSTCGSASGQSADEAFEEFRDAILDEVHRAVTSAVSKTMPTMVKGALQPLEKKLDGVHLMLESQGKRLSALSKTTDRVADDTRELSQSVKSLTGRLEGLLTALGQVESDLSSIGTKRQQLLSERDQCVMQT